MPFGVGMRRLPACVVLALAVPSAAGCLNAYSIRLDVRTGREEAVTVVRLPLLEAEGTAPVSGACVRFRLPWHWGYTGTLETEADGAVCVSFTEPGGAIQQAYGRWFPKGPDERVVHFSCEKEGYNPVVGSFRLAGFRALDDAPTQTVLVIMTPRKPPDGPASLWAPQSAGRWFARQDADQAW